MSEEQVLAPPLPPPPADSEAPMDLVGRAGPVIANPYLRILVDTAPSSNAADLEGTKFRRYPSHLGQQLRNARRLAERHPKFWKQSGASGVRLSDRQFSFGPLANPATEVELTSELEFETGIRLGDVLVPSDNLSLFLKEVRNQAGYSSIDGDGTGSFASIGDGIGYSVNPDMPNWTDTFSSLDPTVRHHKTHQLIQGSKIFLRMFQDISGQVGTQLVTEIDRLRHIHLTTLLAPIRWRGGMVPPVTTDDEQCPGLYKIVQIEERIHHQKTGWNYIDRVSIFIRRDIYQIIHEPIGRGIAVFERTYPIWNGRLPMLTRFSSRWMIDPAGYLTLAIDPQFHTNLPFASSPGVPDSIRDATQKAAIDALSLGRMTMDAGHAELDSMNITRLIGTELITNPPSHIADIFIGGAAPC